jgi:diguanylate cyclase
VSSIDAVAPSSPVARAAAGIEGLRWTGEFTEPVTEGAFRLYQLTRCRGIFSVLAVVFAVVTVGFGASDAAVMGLGPEWVVLFGLRASAAALMVWLGVVVRRRTAWLATRSGARAVTAIEAATLGVFLAVCLLRPVAVGNLHLSAVLLALCVTIVVPGPFRHRVVLVGGFYLAYLVVAAVAFPAGEIRLAPVAAVACATSVNRLERLSFGAMEHQRVLNERLFGEMRKGEALRVELARQAAEDELTGLLTRRAFFAEAAAVLRADEADGAVGAVAMVIDVDRFKSVNDGHGHAAGDEALRTIAARLAGALRAGDVLGRIGGEEFAVLLPATGRAAAEEVAERLRRSVAGAGIDVGGEVLHISVSIGMATSHPGDPLDASLRRADAAMYRSKHTGGDRVSVGD